MINNRFLSIQSLDTKKKKKILIFFLITWVVVADFMAHCVAENIKWNVWRKKKINNNKTYSSFCKLVFNTHTQIRYLIFLNSNIIYVIPYTFYKPHYDSNLCSEISLKKIIDIYIFFFQFYFSIRGTYYLYLIPDRFSVPRG